MGKKVNYIIIGLILYRIAYIFSPFVSFHSPHGLNMISVVALYFMLFNDLGAEKAFTTLIKFVPVYLVSIIDILFSSARGLPISMRMQVYLLLQDMLWVLIMRYVINQNNLKLNRLLLCYVGAFLIITSITTYFGCKQYVGLSRGLTAGKLSDTETILFSTLNIGGFDFLYTIVLTLPLIIYLYKSNNIKLLLSIILMIPLLLAIYQAEYTTALLTAIVCFAAYFFPNNGNRTKFIRISVAMGVTLIFLSSYLSSFLMWLANTVDSDTMYARLMSSSEIASGVGADADSDAATRIDLWMRSLNGFSENILIGSGNRGGGHSWLFDNMSMFGLFGLIACLLVYRSLYKLTVKRYCNTAFYFFALFVFFLQIFLSIVNTRIFYNAFIILLPLFYYSFPSIQEKRSISVNA